MRFAPILLCWTALCLAAEPARKLKVFILAGQSNMQGQGVADLAGRNYNEGKGTLVDVMSKPEAGKRYAHLKQPDGSWTVRNDVWVRYQREGQPLQAGPLSLGFGAYVSKHHFGPEYQFGHVVGQAYRDQVLLIKTAPGEARVSIAISVRRAPAVRSVLITRRWSPKSARPWPI